MISGGATGHKGKAKGAVEKGQGAKDPTTGDKKGATGATGHRKQKEQREQKR